jgi:hypothetical protein
MKRLLTASSASRRLTATSMSRRYLAVRRLAFLMLPTVLVLSTPTVASASAGSRIPEATAARPAAVVAALTAASPTALAATTTNYIYNDSDIGLGVIHVRDGSYTHGTYDVVLAPGTFTPWTSTAGWYTGPGYCTEQYRSDDGAPWTRQYPDLGPGQHFIGAHTSYIVYAYHC